MGALTLKSFPFELRGWELEKFNGIDLTDSFGTNIKISLNNKQIIQIEPNYNFNSIWIHDKARQYFDSLNSNLNKKKILNLWKTMKNLHKIIYLFELCNLKYSLLNYLIIIYENLSINNLCLLTVYSQKYHFIKLKNTKNSNLNNNLEFNFLLNKKINISKLNTSSLCLLISTNPRFEGTLLNLNLKQRLLKGNFKLFTLGSFLDLTYNIKFLGNTFIKVLKSIIEGTHFVCQDLKFSKNPTIVTNSELFKRNNNLIKLLCNFNNLNNKMSLNTLNSTMFETNIYFLNKSQRLTITDFLQFSTLYFICLSEYGYRILNKILQTSIVYLNKYSIPFIKICYLNQNFYEQKTNFENYLNKNLLINYLYIPTKTFFETKEKFLNNQGFIKHTNKLVAKKEAKSNWKIIRSFLNLLKKTSTNFITVKTNLKINLDLKNHKFKTFNYLNNETNKNLNKNVIKFTNNHVNNFFIKTKFLKIKKIKFINTKMKLWLNDFFIGGKEQFSSNSLIMIRCSKTYKLAQTNYF